MTNRVVRGVLSKEEHGFSERSVEVANKRWSELSSNQRRGIAVSGVVQIALLAAALVDVYRRPREEIRGGKWLWTALAFVNSGEG